MLRKVSSDEVKEAVLRKLADRGVALEEIAKLVYQMQISYNPSLTLDICFEHVEAVLQKREVQHALLVGIELDQLAEKQMLSEPLQSIIEFDESLFGCDETLALGAASVYGSIAVTTFGYLDKEKLGIIKRFDSKNHHGVHTFLDDLLAAIVGAAAARVAHGMRDLEEISEGG